MKGTLLIVEDEMDIRNTLQYVLKDKCKEILVAENGIEALEILKKHEVDCVVSDLNMPKLDGLQLLREVRALGKTFPFIIFTAFGNENVVMHALRYGAFDIVDKPDIVALIESTQRGIAFGVSGSDEFSKGIEFQLEYQKILERYKK